MEKFLIFDILNHTEPLKGPVYKCYNAGIAIDMLSPPAYTCILYCLPYSKS